MRGDRGAAPPIETHDLTKEYGSVLANDALSFAVERGEVFGFLGPNGAGKSTTIRMLLGLIRPTSGTATVLGADVHDEPALIDAKRRVGYLPAHLGFDGEVTGADVLEYHASVKGDGRLPELLELFTPPLDRPIREYSTGNERMLGLIQAFMHDPDLVIMDEPTSGLDPLKQEEFNEFVRDERDRGTTVFFSSHVLSEVRRICDRVGIIREGRLVELESVETLLSQGGKRVRVVTADDAYAQLASLDGVVDVRRLSDGVQFIYTGEYNALLAALVEHDVREIDVSEPPLEDVFIHYYGEHEPAYADETDGTDA
ncbi:ABC-2 type transport system ATP-binding protein [Halorubrum aquaticum]|uniref:ABC-2 type transport system ATP-binding protein n=1 Tax=Halorubrum aquaticum TaxID=387340 RepID=A0A1I2YXU6_9EURY|nr:ABC transporter ATP-binding protein [Halorubrum aquaticum]SFH30467.1 ABC-2 type transport system ATP-binding protein [Halorubrum aquaticum]